MLRLLVLKVRDELAQVAWFYLIRVLSEGLASEVPFDVAKILVSSERRIEGVRGQQEGEENRCKVGKTPFLLPAPAGVMLSREVSDVEY